MKQYYEFYESTRKSDVCFIYYARKIFNFVCLYIKLILRNNIKRITIVKENF